MFESDLNFLWNNLLAIGSLGGLFSVGGRIVDFVNRPKLDLIEFNERWDLLGRPDETRTFTILRVKNSGKTTAKRCVATLTFLKKPKNAYLSSFHPLYWTPPTYPISLDKTIELEPGLRSALIIGFVESNINYGTAWLAHPQVLLEKSENLAAAGLEVYSDPWLLPGGEYTIRINLFCENGRGNSKIFKLIVPDGNKGDRVYLRLEQVKTDKSLFDLFNLRKLGG